MGAFDEDESGWEAPIEDIAFLVKSVNRFAALDCLTDGEHSRHVLAEQLGVSRVTIARVLDDLEDRRWITQRGQIAEITPLGAWVVEEFRELCEMMVAERKLRSVVQWFPDEGYGFHISRLKSAEITRVSEADATAPIDRLVLELTPAEHIHCFSFAITGQFLEACWRYVVDRNHTMEWVFTSEVLDVLSENDLMREQTREMLESGRATFYHYQGTIPHVVVMTDSTVNIRLADHSGAPSALIQSADAEVRTWAESTFEKYRGEGAALGAELFAP